MLTEANDNCRIKRKTRSDRWPTVKSLTVEDQVLAVELSKPLVGSLRRDVMNDETLVSYDVLFGWATKVSLRLTDSVQQRELLDSVRKEGSGNADDKRTI